MYTNILKISFSRLKKLEVQFLAKSVIEIVEHHNPENLQIKEIFDKLVELQPQIDHLKIGYGAHPLTLELNKARKKRNAYALGIINQMRTIENGGMSGMEKSIKVAKPKILQYLQGFSKKSEKIKMQTISQFSKLVQEEEALAVAFDELDLTTYLFNLNLVNDEIGTLYSERRENVSARPKANTLIHVATLKTAIYDLFKQIEVAQIKNADLDYKPLIDELNLEITTAKAEVKARASYNKKKAEEAEDNNQVVVESHSEESLEPVEATPEINLMSVDMISDKDLDELDIKKTAAVSSKQTRLPIISNEA